MSDKLDLSPCFAQHEGRGPPASAAPPETVLNSGEESISGALDARDSMSRRAGTVTSWPLAAPTPVVLTSRMGAGECCTSPAASPGQRPIQCAAADRWRHPSRPGAAPAADAATVRGGSMTLPVQIYRSRQDETHTDHRRGRQHWQRAAEGAARLLSAHSPARCRAFGHPREWRRALHRRHLRCASARDSDGRHRLRRASCGHAHGGAMGRGATAEHRGMLQRL